MCCSVTEFSLISGEYPAVVLVNPRAGGGRAARYLPAIQKLFAELSIRAEFVLTDSAEALEVRAREETRAGKRMLLAMGGDGTLQALVNGAQGHDVVLGILPTGGGNDFAAALGLPKEPMAAARAVLEGKPRWVDLLRARTADGRTRLYVGGGGMGLDAESARYSAGAYARVPGRLRYIAAGLRALCSFEALGVRAEFPGGAPPDVSAQVLIAGALNTPSYGAGLRLAPEARIDDGLLTAILVKKLRVGQVLAAVPRLMMRGDLPEAYVTRVSAARVRLSADRECWFHGDGEILGPAPVEIELVPRAVRMLGPAAAQSA